MIYKHELPLIEVEEINLHKSQWELQLEKQVNEPGKAKSYEPLMKVREEIKPIEWI